MVPLPAGLPQAGNWRNRGSSCVSLPQIWAWALRAREDSGCPVGEQAVGLLPGLHRDRPGTVCRTHVRTREVVVTRRLLLGMACLTAGSAVFAQAPRETPLGTGAQVTLHCQSPKSTGEFLHELGFRPVGSDEVRRTGRTQLSDGVLTVGLVQGHPRLPVLTYTAPDMERRAQALKDVV